MDNQILLTFWDTKIRSSKNSKTKVILCNLMKINAAFRRIKQLIFSHVIPSTNISAMKFNIQFYSADFNLYYQYFNTAL